MTCSILTFYSDAINGEDTTYFPRWAGVPGVLKYFSDMTKSVDDIAANYQKAFDGTEWTNNIGSETIPKRLEEEYNKYKDFQLVNPDPSKQDKITPKYIENYGDYKKDKSTLNLIYADFMSNELPFVIFYNTVKGNATFIVDQINPVKDSIKIVTDSLTSMNDAFQKFSDKIVEEIVNSVSSQFNV
jgi:hypothetical protein